MMTVRDRLPVLCSLVALCLSGCSQQSPAPSSNVPAVNVDLGETQLSLSSPADPRDHFELVEQLADLIAARLALMPEVAKAKWNQKLPASVPEREAALLKELVDEATKVGLSAEFAAAFFEAQFAASKTIQTALFAEWEKQSERPQFSDVRDLNSEIRPEITRLSSAMLPVLKQLAPVLKEEPTIELCEGQFSRLVQQEGAHKEALKIAFAPLISTSSASR